MEFIEKPESIREEIMRNVALHIQWRLLGTLYRVHAAMLGMVAEADAIFGYFENNLKKLAGRRMAFMDRRYADLTTDIGNVVRLVYKIQKNNFARQIKNAEDLRRFEILIGVIIVLMILCVTLYGHNIAKVMRRHEDQLEKTRIEAEDANNAKSRFLASMSNEIRTPMNGVLGMVSTLLGARLDPSERENIQIIKNPGEELLDLLNDILDLSKIAAGKIDLEHVDISIADLLSSTVALWQSRANLKSLDFTLTDARQNRKTLRIDGGRLRQILFNLIGNAIKFTESGSVHVTVTELNREDDNIGLQFEVRDTGIGIAEDQITRLFKPFSQADISTTRNYGGTGLGLSISKQLAELLGGEIGVDSTPGEGSVFWFTIAAEEGDPANIADPKDRSETVYLLADLIERPLRILVADDNHINQKVAMAMLASLERTVDVVGNGLEAAEAVMRSPYDVILMDIQMPEMDGLDATRKIRELPGSASEIPIIALTANAMKGDREKYLASGMNDYVSKPIDPNVLFGTIASCVSPNVSDRESDAGAPAEGRTSNVVDFSELISDMDTLVDGTFC